MNRDRSLLRPASRPNGLRRIHLWISITPAGRLALSPDAQTAPELSASQTRTLDEAFATSSAEGLFCLASQALDGPLPAALVFWREWASHFFHALCGLGEEADPGRESRHRRRAAAAGR